MGTHTPTGSKETFLCGAGLNTWSIDCYFIIIIHVKMRSGIWGDRSSIWGDRSSIGADQCKSFVIFIQISLTPGQVATDVCQALEYSTWKAHVHINQRIPTPVLKELLSEDILRMAHTVHSVPLSIFRAQGPPDSLLSSCDPPFWCHGFLSHGDIQIL